MDVRMREAVRYLGYGKHAVDDGTLALITEVFRELDQIKRVKSVYRIFDLQVGEAGQTEIAGWTVTSKNLAKNLTGCDQIVLFGATLGTEVDQLIRRYSLTDMAKAVVGQACAAAELEEYCDHCQRQIAREAERQGRYLRPRFSPGYGDFSIHCQDTLMRMLDCAKTIGLTLTAGGMMTPTKSVTAVIGMSTEKEPCHIKGCEACAKKDCLYRRSS